MILINNKPPAISSEFWNQKYINNQDKWSLNQPTPIFKEWFKSLNNKNNILIPGAGKGDDAFYLASKGHKVYAVDYSIEAINFMKSKVKEKESTLHILHKNIFELEEYYGKFDIFLEYTCFCAILPDERETYIKESSKLLKKGGFFVGILFPINKSESDGGPPFGVNFKQTIKLFKKYYKIIEYNILPNSVQSRINQEIFICLKNV